MLHSVVLGLMLAIYMRLSPHWPETIVVLSILMVLFGTNDYYVGHFIAGQIPLELYHFPRWFIHIFSPLLRIRDKELREKALVRANELKQRLLSEQDTGISSFQDGSIHILLEKTANAIGRNDIDVTKDVKAFDDDLFDSVDQLKGMDIEVLSRYMPRRLAQEVHTMLMD